MDEGVRRRVLRDPPEPVGLPVQLGSDQMSSGGPYRIVFRAPYGMSLLATIVAMVCATFVCMQLVNNRLPPAGDLERVALEQYLRPLTLLGPRPTGSVANDQHAVKMIKGFLSDIKSKTHQNLRLDIDHQVVSGSFSMKSLDGVTSTYANVQNLVARLSPATVANHSVMVNCHFDSAISSPGTSDDLASCSVMLSVLRRLAMDGSTELNHNIIFLFNGAEENMLQGSHGFITQHKWARSIRAYVNLEACGAGGRELVFQSGPGNPWLIKAYAEVVPYPFANIIGQELFQSGIIPSDTDFRIFRDFGRIPGLDTAFISNGYVYHTKYDNLDQLTAGSLQRAAENLQSILRHLSTTDTIVSAQTQDVGSVVFMDLFGVYMIVLPGWVNTASGACLILLVFLNVLLSCRTNRFRVWHVLAGCFLVLFSWIVAAASCVSVAYMLDHYGATMSWYAVRGWIVGLYVSLCWGIMLLIQHSLVFYILNKSDLVWRSERLLFDSLQLLLSGALAAMLLAGLGSSLLLQLLILAPTLLRGLGLHSLTGTHRGEWVVYVSLGSQLLPLALVLYSSTFLLDFFVPILGRFGMLVNPDLIMAVISAALTLLAFAYLSTLIVLVRRARCFALALLSFSLLSFVLVAFTPAGFPYSSQRPHIRAQRLWIQHVERVFHAANGSESDRDSGYLLSHRDYNGRLTDVAELVGLRGSGDGEDSVVYTEQHCDSVLYCGIPYYYPNRRGNYMNDYFPGPPPAVSTPITYSVKKEVRKDSIVRLHFHVTGPDHMTMQLSPLPSVQLVHCSLLDSVSSSPFSIDHNQVVPPTGVPFRGRPVYYFYFSWGLKSAPWRFFVDLLVSEDGRSADSVLLDIVLNGHYLHAADSISQPLSDILNKWPNWSVPVPFTSVLHSFSAR